MRHFTASEARQHNTSKSRTRQGCNYVEVGNYQGYLHGCPIHKTKHCLLQNVYSLGAPTGFSQAKLGFLTASSCFKLLKPPILLKKNLLGLRDCTLFVTNNVWFYEWDIHVNILA